MFEKLKEVTDKLDQSSVTFTEHESVNYCYDRTQLPIEEENYVEMSMCDYYYLSEHGFADYIFSGLTFRK
jgi:hypothetical protein